MFYYEVLSDELSKYFNLYIFVKENRAMKASKLFVACILRSNTYGFKYFSLRLG